MPKSEWLRLRHMLEAAEEAVAFTAQRQRDELESDRMLSLALVKLIETIGEAASNIPLTTQQFYSQIPWQDIIGMRHRLVHGYDEIDLDIVWEVIQKDLPPLIEHLKSIIPPSNP